MQFSLAATLLISYIGATQGSGRSSGVEHNLAKVRVGRSNRLARSIWTTNTPVVNDRVTFLVALRRFWVSVQCIFIIPKQPPCG